MKKKLKKNTHCSCTIHKDVGISNIDVKNISGALILN